MQLCKVLAERSEAEGFGGSRCHQTKNGVFTNLCGGSRFYWSKTVRVRVLTMAGAPANSGIEYPNPRAKFGTGLLFNQDIRHRGC